MSVEIMFSLQELDAKEKEIQEQIKKLPHFKELVTFKRRFEVLQANLESRKNSMVQISQMLKRHETRAAAMEEKIKCLNNQLYDGSVSNPKELQNLQEQIENISLQIGDINTEILDQMEKKEDVEKELDVMSQELKETYKDFNKLKLQYNAAKLNLEQELLNVQEERKAVASHCEEKWLAWYQKHYPKFGGTPIGKVLDNHACSGCRQIIPIMVVRSARSRPGQVVCESCGRLLYAPNIY